MIKYIVSWIIINGYWGGPDPVYKTDEFGRTSSTGFTYSVAVWRETGRESKSKEFFNRDEAVEFCKRAKEEDPFSHTIADVKMDSVKTFHK